MSVVVDASVAIKWVTPETDTDAALALIEGGGLVAPDLIFSECANILWKKVQRGELIGDEAELAARLLIEAPVEIVTTRTLLAEATRLAIRLDHPAYDCVSLALARERGATLITADDRLIRKLIDAGAEDLRALALPLVMPSLT